MQQSELNEAKKSYYEPSHTTEHILNQTMIRMFGCERSKNAHIERKKCKADYILQEAPTAEQLAEIETRVNEVIRQNLTVTDKIVKRSEVPACVDLSKLPEEAGETLRLVYVGDYDICACIGAHVENTSEIGTFKLLNTDYNDGVLRLRFKLVLTSPK